MPPSTLAFSATRSRLTTQLLALLLAALALTSPGCSTAQSIFNSLDKPTARVVGAELTGLTAAGATLDFDLEVQNPYSVPLPIGALAVALSSGGTQFLSADSQPGSSIPARRSGRVTVPASLDFASMLSLLEGVRPGAVIPYRADVNLGVDIPTGERLSLPLSHEGQVPIPAPPTITVRAVNWDELSLQRARGTMTLDIANPNQFAASLRTLDYALSLGGSQVAQARLARGLDLAANASGSLEVPLSFSTSSLGMSLIQAVTSGHIDYSLTGDSDLSTPFGRILMPVTAVGRSPTTR